MNFNETLGDTVSLGPIMLDLRGPVLEDDERELLQHPLVGGVILFSRNYQTPQQLGELTRAIHQSRQPPLLIAVDHEGGRVQRFHDQFSALPASRYFGRLYDEDRGKALRMVEKAGWLLATELFAVGIDFSFTPVLDLDKRISQVIGDRAYHRDPEVVAELAGHFMHGMKTVGMSAVGKHFPGHGSVSGDSHDVVPVDERRYEDMAMSDFIPFERLINMGLAAIMPAHVIYPAVDNKPAGFSPRWLQEILRKRLGFHGVIFSDDISMAGAEIAGDYKDRALAALNAGCDMVLVCNNQDAAMKLTANLEVRPDPASQVRLMRMHGRGPGTPFTALKQNAEWLSTSREIMALDITPELGLGDDEIHS